MLKPIEIEEFQKIMVSVIESVQRENEEGQRLQTAEVQNRRNLLYKIFSSAKIEQEEAEKAEQILNLGTGKHCRILDIEFTENFFEEMCIRDRIRHWKNLQQEKRLCSVLDHGI